MGNPEAQQFSMHGFGAQFAEVRVNEDTGKVRVPRLLGVFAAGRIVNANTARSQFLGGMTWWLSMALHEESVLNPHFGDYVNHDSTEPTAASLAMWARWRSPGSRRTIRTSTRWAQRGSAS
jgi:xanthine dehydrogenase YagR molybdenum-binding subunit